MQLVALIMASLTCIVEIMDGRIPLIGMIGFR